jgi:hypothetical protein
MTIDERISAELHRHAPEVDENSAWDRIRTAAPARQRARTIRLVAVPVAAAGLLVVSIIVSTRSSTPAPLSGAQIAIAGIWETTHLDGSTPRMTVEVSAGAVVEIVVNDDRDSACADAPSTMIGTGQFESDTLFVIPAPVLTCDSGSPPEEGQLDALTFVFARDRGTDTLTDTGGAVWTREGEEVPNTPGIRWPQTSLEQVQEAQELANAGDPDYAWQLEPNMEAILTEGGPADPPEILTRFLRKEVGWEESALLAGSTDMMEYGGFHGIGAQLIRCEPGKSNPIWPNDPQFGGCAPTIDDFHFESVYVFLTQPDKQGPEGIWVAAFSTDSEPFVQIAPITHEGIAAILDAFLQARIAGEGAEQYLGPLNASHVEIGSLYATSSGAPYERAEFEIQDGEIDEQGPLGGAIGLKVRLFAEGGQTVVEQTLELEERAGGWLIYQHEGDQNTENGQPLPRP